MLFRSNLGSGRIKNTAGFGSREENQKREKTAAVDALKAVFRAEFLNRVDEIIVFSRLSEKDTERIAERLLSDAGRRVADIGISLSFDDSAVKLIASEGKSDLYGARPLRRAVTRLVEDPLSEEIIEGKTVAPAALTVTAENGKMKFVKK